MEGKTCVVTAAGQGIGRAIAERLRDEGGIVHASDLNAGALEDLDGARVAALDATDHEAVRDYMAGFERIDVLVHAVGYVHQGTVEECAPADWHRSVDISLTSGYNVLHHAIPRMKAHGGSIVAIASLASSMKGFPRRAAYGASKAGLIGLIKSVAADYVTCGIRANAICPGTIQSPSLDGRIAELTETFGSAERAMEFFISRQPSGRFGTASEIAALAALLASDEGAFLNGQAIAIDGGITI
jgi:2-keto-3-deoxy-L-fuconate dehydrogenase